MVNCAEKTNNCVAARKFQVVKANVWQWRKQVEANKLKNLSVEYHLLVRQWELAKWHNISWHNLKASVCVVCIWYRGVGYVYIEELHCASRSLLLFCHMWEDTVKSKITWVSVMLLVSADGSKFAPHVILNHKKEPKEQLHRVPVVRCQPKCWVGGLVVGGVERGQGITVRCI